MSRRRAKAPVCETHADIVSEVPEIGRWIEMVEGGEVEACQDQHALCALVRGTFESEPLLVDVPRLRRYLGYQQFFDFDLSEEEVFLLALFLCTFREDGLPRWPELLCYVGRGWGKNGFGSFLTFCMASPANGIRYYDVDICATTEEQAKTSFMDLWNILEDDSEGFEGVFDWTKVEIRNLETRSRVKYWSGNAGSKDGMRSGCVFFDEVHAYTDNASMEVFKGGLGKKDAPRTLMLTTDGEVRDGPLDELKARSHEILHEGREDDGLLPFLCHLDDMDEIHDEKMWVKANPRLRSSTVLMDTYRRDYRAWVDRPQMHPMVPTKRFNMPVGRKDQEVTSWDNLVAASRDMGELDGLPCVLGIDYAKTTDMVGACLLFHRDGEWQVVHHAWWCVNSSDAGEVKAPLAEWEDMGLLTQVTDADISPSLVTDWAAYEAASHGFSIQMAAIDSYRMTLMKEALSDIGLDPSLKGRDQQVYLVRPSDEMRVQPIIDSAFANKRIAWGDSPLMRWCANNAKLVPAPNENWKFGKIAPHQRKTDVFMAMVAAFAVCDRIPEPVDMSYTPAILW